MYIHLSDEFLSSVFLLFFLCCDYLQVVCKRGVAGAF